MFAAYAARIDRSTIRSPASRSASAPIPRRGRGWTTVTVRAASLNHHDLWSLRGVGLPADRLPMILGCDAAGVDEDGNEVVVHSVIGDPSWRGDETLDPRRSLLTELLPGHVRRAGRRAAAQRGAQAEALSFEEAACLPTAWLTAYRMLFTNAGVRPGDTVLVQGAGGGVATALIVARARPPASGCWATSRDEAKRRPGRSSSAPTTPSSPARGCRSGSTP